MKPSRSSLCRIPFFQYLTNVQIEIEEQELEDEPNEEELNKKKKEFQALQKQCEAKKKVMGNLKELIAKIDAKLG
jgi:hypothetical protein